MIPTPKLGWHQDWHPLTFRSEKAKYVYYNFFPVATQQSLLSYCDTAVCSAARNLSVCINNHFPFYINHHFLCGIDQRTLQCGRWRDLTNTCNGCRIFYSWRVNIIFLSRLHTTICSAMIGALPAQVLQSIVNSGVCGTKYDNTVSALYQVLLTALFTTSFLWTPANICTDTVCDKTIWASKTCPQIYQSHSTIYRKILCASATQRCENSLSCQTMGCFSATSSVFSQTPFQKLSNIFSGEL